MRKRTIILNRGNRRKIGTTFKRIDDSFIEAYQGVTLIARLYKSPLRKRLMWEVEDWRGLRVISADGNYDVFNLVEAKRLVRSRVAH